MTLEEVLNKLASEGDSDKPITRGDLYKALMDVD